MSDLQTMFNIAVEGLAKQEFKHSIKPDNGCAFRSPTGLKCAIGHCLDDNEISYYEGQEDNSTTLRTTCKKYNTSQAVIRELQLCHDQNNIPFRMKDSLRKFALNYKLTMPDVLT